MKKQTMTVGEAAERLGISKQSAYKYARAGDLPVVRLGRRFLIVRARFDAMFMDPRTGRGESSKIEAA